jgi:hypothetical protein
MLEKYFSAPKTLRRLRSGISGPHIDAFADDLERDGYAPTSAVRYIRAASHLGCFIQRRGGLLADIDFNTLHCLWRPSSPLPMPSFQTSKDQLSRAFWSEAFPSTVGRLRDLPE